jgi:putative salt-induced outer membrane protein YdiY
MRDITVRFCRLLVLVTACIVLAPRAAAAQAPPALGWSYSAKLTAVWASGNSQSSTFGLGSTLRRVTPVTEFRLEAGAIRADASLGTRRAVGSPGTFMVQEQTDRQKTAESYLVRAREDWKLSSHFLAFGGADWQRNTFAGIDSRTVLSAGAGNIWAESERFHFKTDYGVTYTFEKDVVDNPAVNSNFPGLRASAELRRTLTKTTKWESGLVSDLNLSNTKDVRVDFTNSVSLSISRVLALKPSLQLLWRNQPALGALELFAPTGVTTGQTVLVPLQKLDSFFTLALVVTV